MINYIGGFKVCSLKFVVPVRPSQVVFLFLVPSRINFWLCTILAIIGIVHALFYLMLIAKHIASVYRLVKCLYTCKNCMVGL